MDGEKINLITLLGTIGMLTLACSVIVFVITYQRRMFKKQRELKDLELNTQKKLMEAVILTKEKEQKRMAQELHDGIGSALTALKVSLIQMNLDKEDKRQIDTSIKAISTDVRRISNELMPSILEDMGLQIAIEHLIDRLKQQSSISFEYSRAREQLSERYESIELAVYRVVQELVNNIVKYAGASSVTLQETITGQLYLLEIRDNGSGFIPSEKELTKPGSLGLKNIRSRILQVNGKIAYAPGVSEGTRVTIEVPLKHTL